MVTGKLYLLLLLAFIPCVSAYSTLTYNDGSTQYIIFLVNNTEQPLNISYNFANYTFMPYYINYTYNYTDNETNLAYENSTLILQNSTYLDFECGQLLTCHDRNINESASLYANFSLQSLATGIYETYIRLYVNNTLYNETLFKVFISTPSVYNETGVLEFGDNINQSYIIYNGELPFFQKKLYSIKSQPNATININCTGFLSCSLNSTNTDYTVFFEVALIIPTTVQKGFYNDWICINTSYGKTLNVTYSIEIRDSAIKLIENIVYYPKNLSQMTDEEKIKFFEDLAKFADESILKMQEANRTTTEYIEKEVEKPYFANLDEVTAKFMDIFNKENTNLYTEINNQNADLLNKVNQKNDEVIQAQNNLNKMLEEKNAEFKNYNQSLYGDNFVVKKTYITYITISIVVLIAIAGCFVVAYIRSYPWAFR